VWGGGRSVFRKGGTAVKRFRKEITCNSRTSRAVRPRRLEGKNKSTSGKTRVGGGGWVGGGRGGGGGGGLKGDHRRGHFVSLEGEEAPSDNFSA